MSIKVEIRMISPEEATRLLTHRHANRNIVPRRVTAIAVAMSNGTFLDDGAPIRISDEGQLLDGQHRLSAIEKTGIPQRFVVISNIDPATLIVMDTGKSRTFDDYLTIKQVPNARSLAAATSFLWKYQNGIFSWKGDIMRRPSATLTDLWGVWEKNSAALEEGLTQTRPVTRSVKVQPALVTGMWVILSALDYEDAEEFYAQLAGKSDELSDGVKALRRRLNDVLSSEGSLDQRRQTAFWIKAWNNYRAGDVVQVLYWRPGGAQPEKFPKPK
jgi:hypothetical protein